MTKRVRINSCNPLFPFLSKKFQAPSVVIALILMEACFKIYFNDPAEYEITLFIFLGRISGLKSIYVNLFNFSSNYKGRNGIANL